MELIINFLLRWAHVLFGITWIGLLYYFNFIQTEYFKEAEPDAKADATKKLAPRALWWFRWAAMGTFLTGAAIIGAMGSAVNGFLIVGAVAGTLMFLNVWLIIWPNQKIVIGLVGGDGAAAAPKAGLASRTNTLLSGAMLLGMLGSKHGTLPGLIPVSSPDFAPTGLIIALLVIAAVQVNALVGKMGPMASVSGVIHSNIVLTVLIWAILSFI